MKLEKSLEHLRKQMEDALLFQAQAEETCALWQAGGWEAGGSRVPTMGHRILHCSWVEEGGRHKGQGGMNVRGPGGGFACQGQ